jgi:hypothetical protein
MRILVAFILASLFLSSCNKRTEPKDEQITIAPEPKELPDSLLNNVIDGNASLSQLESYPHNVILTGLPEHRLVTIYKERKQPVRKDDDYTSSYYYYSEEFEDDRFVHFMPGLDLLYGYNLLNIAHYDLRQEKLNYLFNHAVLVKSLYFPSFIQDSLNEKPINRDYYFVSVYDADTNRDSLINKNDLRHFYYFNSSCTEKIQIIPHNYSVVRSEYDRGNDVMYVFARHDANSNGTADKKEPVHIFWIDLKSPRLSKRLY